MLVAALALLGLPALVAGCQKQSEPAPAEAASETAGATATGLAIPGPISGVAALAPVGRAELLEAARAAADDLSAGGELPKANLQLTSRLFELRLPIACGSGGVGDWGQWTFDAKTRVLRVTFRPQNWADDPQFREAAGAKAYDAAEGFWIERPWTRAEQCPAVAEPPAAVLAQAPAPSARKAAQPPSPELSGSLGTLAVVQYFSPDAPRTMQRGDRAYAYTAKLPPGAERPAQGLRVKITGRIAGFPDGQPIHCVARKPSQPPLCVAGIEFTQVALEDAASGKILTDWGG